MRRVKHVGHPYVVISALILLWVVAACSSVGTSVDGGDGGGDWSYGSGPRGERCLFYSEGALENRVLAMSCDRVGEP